MAELMGKTKTTSHAYRSAIDNGLKRDEDNNTFQVKQKRGGDRGGWRCKPGM